MTLAKVVEVRRKGTTATITVDGEPFPWLVGREIRINSNQYDAPSVTIELLAEHVILDNDIS